MVFLNENYFGVRGCGFTLALFDYLPCRAVLSWPPLFCRIILLVHHCWRCIVVVALRHLILVSGRPCWWRPSSVRACHVLRCVWYPKVPSLAALFCEGTPHIFKGKFWISCSLACSPVFYWRCANGLCLLDAYFWPSRLAVITKHNVSCWVIYLDLLAWWARNYCGVVFLNDDYFGVCGCGFTLALFDCLPVGAVLSWPPLFCRIILLVHPRCCCIVVVALWCLILVRAGWWLRWDCYWWLNW